jgi:hypothetical protein
MWNTNCTRSIAMLEYTCTIPKWTHGAGSFLRI